MLCFEKQWGLVLMCSFAHIMSLLEDTTVSFSSLNWSSLQVCYSLMEDIICECGRHVVLWQTVLSSFVVLIWSFHVVFHTWSFLWHFVLQGENPKKPGNPHNVRLYSIASTRYGDKFDGKTASFCVRRAVYYDPETGKEDPSKNGVCSNFLCDSKPGDKVKITGTWKVFSTVFLSGIWTVLSVRW